MRTDNLDGPQSQCTRARFFFSFSGVWDKFAHVGNRNGKNEKIIYTFVRVQPYRILFDLKPNISFYFTENNRRPEALYRNNDEALHTFQKQRHMVQQKDKMLNFRSFLERCAAKLWTVWFLLINTIFCIFAIHLMFLTRRKFSTHNTIAWFLCSSGPARTLMTILWNNFPCEVYGRFFLCKIN